MKQKDKKIDNNKKQNKQSPQYQLMLSKNKKTVVRLICIFLLFVLIGAGSLALVIYLEQMNRDPFNNNPIVDNHIISVIVGPFIFLLCILYFTLVKEMMKTRLKRERVEEEIDNISNDKADDLLENSLRMSYKYLDQYYLQTREHAQKGFIVTVTVSICGAIIVAAGIIAMFFEKGNASYIATASGVITEFIATIFFYLYNKTVQIMGAYHNKLVLSQNIALALKTSDSLSDNVKNDAKRAIINELIKDANNHITSVDDSSN